MQIRVVSGGAFIGIAKRFCLSDEKTVLDINKAERRVTMIRI